MYRMIDFSNWEINLESPYGSGASEKIWLISPDLLNKGIFKYPKKNTDGSITGEYWAEKLAVEIGKVIGLKHTFMTRQLIL